MDSPHGPTFGGRVPPHHCSRPAVKSMFFAFFCGCQNVGLAHLAAIDIIVDPGHSKAYQRVEDTLETKRDGWYIHRGDVLEAVGDMLSVRIKCEIAFTFEHTDY